MNNNNNKHIAKEFYNSAKKEQIFLTNDFNDSLFRVTDNPEIIHASIIVFRLIFKILNDVRNQENSFNSKDSKLNPIQLNLFEQAYKTIDNTYASFSYKISELDKNRNYAALQKSLEFLVNFKMGTHEYYNRDGKKYKFVGGFLTDVTFTTGRVSFLINTYWIEKMLLSDAYNDVLFATIEKLKEPKYVLFYLWILRLPENGTSVNFENLIQAYDLNYKSYPELYKNFLYPLRMKLNKFSNYSFNVNKVPKGTKIGISRQELAPKLHVSEELYSNLKIREKTAYYKKRHSLSEAEASSIKNILSSSEGFVSFNESYAHFVKNCRLNKVSSANFKGSYFIEEIKKSIIETKSNISL